MKKWHFKFSKKAEKSFAKFDKQTQQRIISYTEKVENSNDPFAFGKPLVGNLTGCWRYRVGKYRIICEIQRSLLIIEIIKIDKRDSVYD